MYVYTLNKLNQIESDQIRRCCLVHWKEGIIPNQRGFRGFKKGLVHGTEPKRGFENCNEFEAFFRDFEFVSKKGSAAHRFFNVSFIPNLR
jgi:hypothetical protein